jgi:hypothetical protein
MHFKTGDEINSGGSPERANSARLQILGIDSNGVRYKSIKSKRSQFLEYATLEIVLTGFARIDPNAIQRTIQPIYIGAGLKENLWTENYEYGFAREFLRRQERRDSFRAQKEANDKGGMLERSLKTLPVAITSTTAGCPILRAFCEGWECTNPQAS